MTTYYRSFNDADGISDWTQNRFQSGVTFSVSSNTLVENTNTTQSGISWDDLDGDANRDNIEIVGQYNPGIGTSVNQRCWFVRGSGTDFATDVTFYYLRLIPGGSATLAIGKRVSGTNTSISSVSVTATTNTLYWIRFRVNGTSLKARIWAVGDEEPGTWTVDTTDSAVTGTGWAGCLSASTTTTQVWKYFGVGTNGDTAPTSAPVGGSLLLPRRVLRQQHLLIR